MISVLVYIGEIPQLLLKINFSPGREGGRSVTINIGVKEILFELSENI